MQQKVRVLIVDDSVFMRTIIADILNEHPKITVVGNARHGKEALQKVKDLQPDVVTLDVEMPVMDGITTLKRLMVEYPVPVIMVSSSTTDGAAKTIQAISIGAVDFISKTSGPISLDLHKIKETIIEKVLTAAHVTVKEKEPVERITKIQTDRLIYEQTIVGIGTSTGGPRALQNILTKFSKDIQASFLIVQHMPAGFTKSLAERLNSLADIQVKEAKNGELIKQSTAYIAPGDYHMLVKKTGRTKAIKLTKDLPVNNHRPSVDVLFDSIAQINHINKIAVILTGMGKDGASGLKNIKNSDNNCMTIAESKQTAIVDGMPAAAIQTKKVDQVLPLHQIGQTLEDLITKTRRE